MKNIAVQNSFKYFFYSLNKSKDENFNFKTKQVTRKSAKQHYFLMIKILYKKNLYKRKSTLDSFPSTIN